MNNLKPSQWINIGWAILAVISLLYFNEIKIWGIGAGWIGVLVFIYKVYEVSCWHYEFDIEHICERKGVFTVSREYVQWYRIKSIMIEEPFIMRLVGLSNIHIITSEQFKPNIKLYAIKDGITVKDFLDNKVLMEKTGHQVHEVDNYHTNQKY